MDKNYSLSELPKIAKEVIERSPYKTLLIYGAMGTGKTTLIKEICKILGTDDLVSSPTFSIVNQYLTHSNEIIYHFDLYRISDKEEVCNIGIEDYFYSNAWCLVEWPCLVENLVSLKNTKIHLTTLDSGQRHIQLR